MRVKKGEWKSVLKFNTQKTKLMASSSIYSWQIDGEIMEIVTGFVFLGSKITADGDCSHEIKTFAPWGGVWWGEVMTNLDSILKFSRGGRNGNPIQYSCLENPMDRGAWWAAVHGVTNTRTWLKPLCRHASSSIAGFILWHYRQGAIQGLRSVEERVSS